MGINPFDHGSEVHTDVMKTEALKQALDKHGFDVAFGGARRDEERSRAKERIFSFRNAQHSWDPKNQRPELWRLLQRAQAPGGVDPRVPALQLDRARRLAVHLPAQIPIVPLYFAALRPVVERDGTLIMVDDERMPARPRRVPGAADGPLPHARLLPAHGRGGVGRRGRCRRSSASCCGDNLVRAPGPRHRPRRRRLDGDARSARGTSEPQIAAPSSEPDRRAARGARAQVAAALPDVRLGRRRQVDADRAAPVRERRALRRPAGGARGRLADASARRETSSTSRC